LAKVRARLEESKISETEFLDILRCAQIAEAVDASSLADINTRHGRFNHSTLKMFYT
jgi:hypothetical protein